MFKDKTIVLSGKNSKFNDFFLINYFKKCAKIVVVEDYLGSEFKNADIVFHYVGDEMQKIHGYFTKDEDDFRANIALKESMKHHAKKVVFLSDGTTPIENERMLKNLMLRYVKKPSKTMFIYALYKGCKNPQQMVEFAKFVLKNAKSGDVFVKKVYERMTFANRIKSLISSKTKIEQNRDNLFTSTEMARSVDLGEYIKVPMESYILEEAWSPSLHSPKVWVDIKRDFWQYFV